MSAWPGPGLCRERGVLARTQQLPAGATDQQRAWLEKALNEAGVLNPLKMPNFCSTTPTPRP